MDSKSKDKIIRALVAANPSALTEQGGGMQRTPIHNIFNDTASLELTKYMLDQGGSTALGIPDKNGYLPAHIACSRNCSREKIEMLLAAYPASLTAETNDGDTLLSLARSTATALRPNHSLIAAIKEALQGVRYTANEAQETESNSFQCNVFLV